MKATQKLKMAVDIGMTILILVLMAYQITGQLFHEIAGTVMIVLFLAHHILNHRWYGSLFKGKYSAYRIYATVINIALCVVVILLAYSGITMSGHVFRWIPNRTGAATARLIHLAASYWGFVFMSLHLGNHWSMMLAMFRKMGKRSTNIVRTRVLQGVGWLIAIYGAICFWQSGLLSYMTLANQFVFFDDTQPSVMFFLQYLAMMGFFVFCGYYIAKGLQIVSRGKWNAQNKEMKTEKKQGKQLETMRKDMEERTKQETEKKVRKTSMKKIKKRWIVLGIILVLAIVVFCTTGITYIRRHFVTNEMSVDTVVNGNHAVLNRTDKILTVYFTRLGNSDFEEDVDAVSSASLILDGETLYGNSQVLAQMVQNVAGGDIYAITTKDKYPSSYGKTTNVAKKELDANARPELTGEDINFSAYDTIVLVYPVWWGRIPMPVATFLEKYDFTGKKVLPLVTHGGSGAGDSIADIEHLCSGTIGPKLEIYDDEVDTAREAIVTWLGQN